MEEIIVVICVVGVVVILLSLSLCRAAAMADRKMDSFQRSAVSDQQGPEVEG